MTQTQTWPQDVLDALPESRQIECIEGALIVNPPPAFRHQAIVNRIRAWLDAQVDPRRVLEGIGIDNGPGWWIPDLVVLVPHYAMWVEADKSIQDPRIVALAIEVASPGNTRLELDKRQAFWHDAVIPYILVDRDGQLSGWDLADWDIDGLAAHLEGGE